MLKRGGPSRQLVAAIRLDAQVTRTTSTNSQPPSRIKTWDRNICSDGRSNPTKCGWRHHLLYISGFGDKADARVIIIAGLCEGQKHTSLCLASHDGPYNVAMSRPNEWANPKFLSGRVGGHDEQVSNMPTTLPNKNLGSQHM